MEKEITIDSTEIEKSIKSVGKTFNVIAFKELMEKFEIKIDEISAASKKHQVRGSDSEVKSIDIASTAKKLDKVIDAARMSAKRPYLDFNQSLDGMVRPLQKSLKVIEADERKKCTKYRNELLRLEREAEAKKPKMVEIGGLKLNVGVKPVEKAEATVSSIAAGSGSYKAVPVAELVDITKVPEKYLLVDWKKVNSDLKDGIKSIPGFTIKEEMKMTIRS